MLEYNTILVYQTFFHYAKIVCCIQFSVSGWLCRSLQSSGTSIGTVDGWGRTEWDFCWNMVSDRNIIWLRSETLKKWHTNKVLQIHFFLQERNLGTYFFNCDTDKTKKETIKNAVVWMCLLKMLITDQFNKHSITPILRTQLTDSPSKYPNQLGKILNSGNNSEGAVADS